MGLDVYMASAVLTTKEYKFSRPMSELILQLIWFAFFRLIREIANGDC